MSVLTYEKICMRFYLTKNLNFLIRDLSGEFKVTPQARRCVLIISRIISDNFYAPPLTVTCQLKPMCLIKNQKIEICQFLLKHVGFNWQLTVRGDEQKLSEMINDAEYNINTPTRSLDRCELPREIKKQKIHILSVFTHPIGFNWHLNDGFHHEEMKTDLSNLEKWIPREILHRIGSSFFFLVTFFLFISESTKKFFVGILCQPAVDL